MNYIPLQDAAQQLGVNKETLRRAVQSNKLEAIRLGRKLQTTKEWLQAYLDSQKVQAKRDEGNGN